MAGQGELRNPDAFHVFSDELREGIGEASCGLVSSGAADPLNLQLQMPAHSLEVLAALYTFEILIKHV